jgi:hypothetical protein
LSHHFPPHHHGEVVSAVIATVDRIFVIGSLGELLVEQAYNVLPRQVLVVVHILDEVDFHISIKYIKAPYFLFLALLCGLLTGIEVRHWHLCGGAAFLYMLNCGGWKPAVFEGNGTTKDTYHGTG